MTFKLLKNFYVIRKQKPNIYKSNKIGSKKMERFSAKVSIEELKAKAKNTNTTKSTCQWLRVYLSWAKLRNKE